MERKALEKTELAYKKAPGFYDVFPLIQTILNSNAPNISNLVYNSLRVLQDYLQINTPVVATSTIYHNSELKAQEKILDICRQEKSAVYINPAGGTDLYDGHRFADKNIELLFLQPQVKPYKQFGSVFVPGLSIIDVLMFNSRQQVQEMLQHYSLISSCFVTAEKQPVI